MLAFENLGPSIILRSIYKKGWKMLAKKLRENGRKKSVFLQHVIVRLSLLSKTILNPKY